MRLTASNILIIGSVLSLAGCTSPWTHREPDSELRKREEAVKDVFKSDERPRLIGEAAAIFGADTREYKGFGIVNGLMDTGGDVLPGSQRNFILKEMRSEGLDTPNQILATKSTAVARLTLFVGPDSTKGDSLDLNVEIASDCEATSLRNGWLMPSRLNDMQFLGGNVRSSDLKARAQGALVILPESFTKKPVDPKLAVILGGGKLVEARRFTIQIRDSLRHVTTSAAISRAINDRYSFYVGSERKGVATAKNDNIISLEMPTRYHWDVRHYADVILSIGFAEESEEVAARIATCRRLIQEPTTARQACLDLEAIGKLGIPVLEEGLNHSDQEIQFYAAYSLAYLNHPPAASVLANVARKVVELRPLCLVGLQLLDHYSAKDELEQLLQETEPELRYGALLALRRRDPRNAMTFGEPIGELAHVISIPSEKPLITVALQERPEIAIFGDSSLVQMNDFFEVNPRMTMRSEPDGQIRLVRFQPNDEDLTALVAPDVISVIDGIRTIGGTYNDLVVWLDEASRRQWIAAPISMNPRPAAGRVYDRNASTKAALAELSQDTSNENEKKAWWHFK
ncbi:MAG: flagellar basal body P-ring protein FlgI [Pirellulaceae bacterium]|nr:flagellar basal body P-ring protein FlgI [Pirellulaceae bacterium]